MEYQLKTEGWVIFSEGDESVGIWNGEWRLTGTMFFDDVAGMDAFRQELLRTFEMVADPVSYVMTFEEEKAMIDAENKMWDAMTKEP